MSMAHYLGLDELCILLDYRDEEDVVNIILSKIKTRVSITTSETDKIKSILSNSINSDVMRKSYTEVFTDIKDKAHFDKQSSGNYMKHILHSVS